jgi:subtilisin-like proprotein convertase family protein
VPDIGADEFSLVLFDIEMQALIQPTNNSGCFTNNQNVRVRIKNLAGQAHDFSSYPVFVQIDVSGANNTQLLTQINDNAMVGGPLGSLQSLLYDAGTLNMTTYGDYNFRCKVYFPQDQNYANDSLSAPVVITNTIPLVLPSSVSFNAFNGSNLNTVFPDWNEATGLTPTITNSSWNSVSGLGGAGNVTARVNLNTAGAYNWILSKKMQAASNSLLTFDAAVCTPFAFTRDTLSPDDRLDIMVSTDCGLTYTKIDSFDFSDGWNQNLQGVVVPLSQFNGQDIIVGLRAYSGATIDGDCDLHIDNIMLFNSSAADLEMKQILQPLASNCYPAASAVQLTIANVGFVDINFATSPLIVYMRTSGAQTQLISDTINTGTLIQGANLNITLNDSLNLTVPGQYFTDAFLVLSGGDVDVDNDTLSVTLISQNPTATLNTARDTVCFANNAIVYSDAAANGLGINNLAPIAYTGLPVAIPDGAPNGIMIPLNVSGTAGFASQLVSVEVANLTHQFIAEIRIELVAPNGSKILLSELLGGSGTAYTNTVFRMNALNPITSASAPFTGSFLPMQNFNLLTGPANGTWHLKVTDLASGDLGSVTAWNLVFREPNSLVSHSWQSPLQNVSSNADSAIYTVNQNNIIIYTATDVYGCQIRDSLNIFSTQDVQWNQPAITACGNTNIPLIGGTPAGGYYVGNGVVNDTLRTILAGSGTQQIKYFYLSAGCLDSAAVTANISLITLSSGAQVNVNCNGNNTGSATVNVAQASGPVSYLWNDTNNQNTATATNLIAGNYTVTVTDAICSAQLNVTITQPSALNSSFVQNNINCFGINNGQIDLTVSGSVSPYTYAWSNGATTQDLNNLTAGNYTVTIIDANACSSTLSATISSPSQINAGLITVNPLCNNQTTGSINLTVNGGVAPYSYNWSNSAITEDLSNLTAGNYTVTITDANSCTISSSALITSPSAISPTVTVTNLLCNGSGFGSIDLSVNGGVAPYQYIWSNNSTNQDLTNLSPGVYTVTITDNNSCVAQQSATVTVPTTLLTNAVVNNLLCNATGFGSINLTAGGGIPPYNYLWSNNSTTEDLNNLSVGVYSVSVSDVNGCSATQTLTITQPSVLTSTVVSNNVLCNNDNNGSINLSTSGGTSPYNYLWSNNATTEDIANLAPGAYTVAISDANGCTTTSSTTITEPASYSISAIISDETIGNDGAINLDIQGANPPYSFSWNNAQTSEDLTGLIGGNYTITISDANNCDTILTFNVPTVVSVGQIAAGNELSLYPNPAYNYIILTAAYSLNAQIITIFDANGKEIESFYNASLPLEMDIKNFSPGLYIIRIQEHDKVVNLKFVKKL